MERHGLRNGLLLIDLVFVLVNPDEGVIVQDLFAIVHLFGGDHVDREVVLASHPIKIEILRRTLDEIRRRRLERLCKRQNLHILRRACRIAFSQ